MKIPLEIKLLMGGAEGIFSNEIENNGGIEI